LSKIIKKFTINYPSVGPIIFERRTRTKYLYIRVKSAQEIKVSLPYHFSLAEAQKLVENKLKWIKEKISQFQQDSFSLANQQTTLFDFFDWQKAQQILPERLKQLAQRYGFKYNKVSVRKQKNIWGSCSPKNNISLNMKLIRLPARLSDYILLHELVHTQIKNHGQKFWQKLNSLVGNAQKLEKELKKYKIERI